MTTSTNALPKWVLLLSALFSVMELLVGISIYWSPASFLEPVDLSAKGVNMVVEMWAIRQFALGVIFAYATYNKSRSMLILSYLFFLVMFAGDLLIGITQKETPMIASAAVMCLISAFLLYILNKRS